MRASLAAVVVTAAALIAVAAAAIAQADPPPLTPVEPASRIDVVVGETASREVGIAQGLRCDDTGPAKVALHTVAANTNRLDVTGVAPGHTACRVGLTLGRPSFLFEIDVAPSRPPR